LEKVKKRFEELSSLLVNDPDSMILIVGTMWDEEDVYADIIMNREGVKDWEELLKKKIHIGKFWNIYIRRAKEPDGTLNFPNALPQEKLDKVANDQSLRKHRLQYYNDLAMNHDTIFKQDWRDKAKTLWEELEKDSKGFPICPYKVLLVDPAISKNKDADYSGIIPLGIKGNIKVILDAYQERLDALELMDTIFSMCEQHGIRRVFIEISGFQRVICTLLRQECRKRGTYLNITEYNPGTKKTKEERIETLVPKFRQGLIAYSRNFTDLDNQLKKFPNFSKREHDDLIDALSIAELALTDNMFNLDISKYAKEDLEIKDNFLFPSLGM
jgi:predicted phage terminase large subunit-like protein